MSSAPFSLNPPRLGEGGRAFNTLSETETPSTNTWLCWGCVIKRREDHTCLLARPRPFEPPPRPHSSGFRFRFSDARFGIQESGPLAGVCRLRSRGTSLIRNSASLRPYPEP